MVLDESSPWFLAERRRRTLAVVGEVFAERGFAGTTMEDLAEATAVSRSSLYALGRGCHELLVLAAAQATDAEPPLLQGRPPHERVETYLGRRAAERQERVAALEITVRGVAASGVPRARGFVAQLELRRREEALAICQAVTQVVYAVDVHRIELLLQPWAYAHLVGRCGWTGAEFASGVRDDLAWLARGRVSERRAAREAAAAGDRRAG